MQYLFCNGAVSAGGRWPGRGAGLALSVRQTSGRAGDEPMVEAVLRRGRRRAVERMAAAAAGYAGLGWPVCLGAYPPGRAQRPGEACRACSCDRVGCPNPGAHPLSPAWQLQATADPAIIARWWQGRPEANVILATGRVFDVLDVPADAGAAALAMMVRSGVSPGPVAISAGDRALFFVHTRGVPTNEDEWWSCHLDCEPELMPQAGGLRWHCRDSYVLAPPSRHGGAHPARWLRAPDRGPLPDGLRLLEILADACDAVA
jgi:Bifunctional DNA primase/polymerase, N-terminal